MERTFSKFIQMKNFKLIFQLVSKTLVLEGFPKLSEFLLRHGHQHTQSHTTSQFEVNVPENWPSKFRATWFTQEKFATPEKQGWQRAFSYMFSSRGTTEIPGGGIWENREVIAPQGRSTVLEELHDTQTGNSSMIAIAQNYVWWPGMDKDIKKMVKHCTFVSCIRKHQLKHQVKHQLKHQLKHHCIHGSGLDLHDPEFTMTYRVI